MTPRVQGLACCGADRNADAVSCNNNAVVPCAGSGKRPCQPAPSTVGPLRPPRARARALPHRCTTGPCHVPHVLQHRAMFHFCSTSASVPGLRPLRSAAQCSAVQRQREPPWVGLGRQVSVPLVPLRPVAVPAATCHALSLYASRCAHSRSRLPHLLNTHVGPGCRPHVHVHVHVVCCLFMFMLFMFMF